MKNEVKDIGIDVKAPETVCNDQHCPFHGKLPVRGQVIDGVVVSDKMQNTAVVERNYLNYDHKFERYVKKSSRYSALPSLPERQAWGRSSDGRVPAIEQDGLIRHRGEEVSRW
jgi:ribosomal protein uS17